MNLTSLVVPVECDANVPFAFPLGGDGIVVLKRTLCMLCMLVSDIFDSKNVNDECEIDWSPVMLPKTGNKFALSVATFV